MTWFKVLNSVIFYCLWRFGNDQHLPFTSCKVQSDCFLTLQFQGFFFQCYMTCYQQLTAAFPVRLNFPRQVWPLWIWIWTKTNSEAVSAGRPQRCRTGSRRGGHGAATDWWLKHVEKHVWILHFWFVYLLIFHLFWDDVKNWPSEYRWLQTTNLTQSVSWAGRSIKSSSASLGWKSVCWW